VVTVSRQVGPLFSLNRHYLYFIFHKTKVNMYFIQFVGRLARISHHMGYMENTVSGGQAFLPGPKRPNSPLKKGCV
jgi:hypothetical protein